MNSLSKTLLKLVLTLFFIGMSSPSSAQKSIQDLAELKDKKWDKLVKSYKNNSTWIDQLKGLLNENLLSEDNLPNPKKIGVLTMQIWDKSVTKSSKIGNTTLFTKNYLTPSGSNLVADKFLNEMLPIFQNKFQEQNISLLEPKDFLTGEEKINVYKEGVNNVEMSGLSKALRNSFTRMLTDDVKGQGSLSATGYEFYPLSASIVATDFKAPASIGLIAENLDLDAVLILTVNVSLIKNGKSMVLHGIETALVGPIDDDKTREYKGRIGAGMMNKYRDGLTFSSVYFEVEPFEIAELNKKTGQINQWHLDGLETVTSRMANDLITGMKKFIALDKSRK
ncbi:hypothetical protein J4050_04250 [Winogradskyella sp. DF17]|jgi:hypothetical protein|uniref:Uncharacterized protein n=1 Tax=Winogradskyella pelagia TaxID=2819984 RepID=A0ABS3SZM9_9FLAO|nr:hypothetical protein [Winogradskyella sp. DF17]MBO3115943.1 hypothetical protein [Winogradskyella sp. DF17]